jgi:hypothetical protein
MTRRSAWWRCAGLVGTLLLVPTRASGADCPPAEGPWLRVELEGDAFTPSLRARVLEQMAADLGERGIATCAGPAEGTPLGDVQLALTRPANLSIDLRDDVTQKKVSRTLSLAGVPPDALGLSIALAAEELLHASWIEAALTRAPTPGPAVVPPVVPRAVVESNATVIAQLPRPPVAYAALMAAADHATGGQTAFGGDLRLMWGGRLTVGVRAGARETPETTSEHGSIRQRELLVGVATSYSLVPRASTWGGEIFARVDAIDLQLSGVASPGALASSGSALAVVAAGGLGGWLRLGGVWRAVVEGAIGAPLHGVTASDAGRTETGLTGATFAVGLGVGAAL